MSLLIVPDDVFLPQLAKEVHEALSIITEHQNDGENQFLPITGMFPDGAQDLLYEIFKKVVRARGYLKKGVTTKVRMELQDILNYAGFALAYQVFQQEEENKRK